MIRRDDLPGLRLLFGIVVRRRLPLAVLASLLGLVAAALNTLQPLLLAPIVDTATASAEPAASFGGITLNNVGATLVAWTGHGDARTWRVVMVAALAYVALVAVSSLFAFSGQLLTTRIRAHLFRDLQEWGYRHLLGLDLPYFARHRTGDLAARLSHDALKVAESAEPVMRGVIQSSAQLALSVFILVRTNAGLAVGVAAAFAAHLAITRLLRDRFRRFVARQTDLFSGLSAHVHEAISSIRLVKSFGAERFETEGFVDRASRFEQVTIRDGAWKSVEAPLRELADAAGLVIVLLMSFGAFMAGQLTLSGLVLFVAVARRAVVPAARLAEAALLLQTTLGAASRFLALVAAKPSMTDGADAAPPLCDEIRLDGVEFAYGEAAVLHGVSLVIRRGEMVAFVGPSGAGKSTLVDLILRFYDPIAGRISWDGRDVREFTQATYRQRFGIVSQDVLLFNATIAGNIAYGRPLDRAAMIEVARVAHVDRFVQGLPEGYETVVGERGLRLSGGERQRLALARALYGRPQVLVLDEATNALDAETEAAVQEALDAMTAGLTVIVIAHRLSTIVRADRIVVIDNGRIEAIGTHDQLLRASAVYQRLCRQQIAPVPELA